MMANLIGVGIAQLRRYEKGKSSPTLDVIKNIARTLGISADELIFDEHERVAAAKILDRKLLEQFDTDENGWLDSEERAAARKVHEANQAEQGRSGRRRGGS